MNHEAAVSNAKDIADRVLAPAARENDKEGRFSSEAIKAFGPAGLLGLMLPADIGGSALGPRTFAAVVSALAEADASVAMVYLMHVCAAATIAAARNGATVAPTLQGDRRRAAFVDAGIQRDGVAQPFLGAGLAGATKRGRSSHHGQKVVRDQRRPSRQLCGLDAGSARRRSDQLDALSRSKRTLADFQSPAPGTALVCGPTPPRR